VIYNRQIMKPFRIMLVDHMPFQLLNMKPKQVKFSKIR